MAAKRFLQRIDINKVNMVLYGVILCLVVIYHHDLQWAARVFPDYLRGRIYAPREVRLCARASRIIEKGGDISGALPLLEKSLKIDPNGEALFWLGEYHFQTGDRERALGCFARYREIDPSNVKIYLRCACIHEMRGDFRKSRVVLQEGIDHFGDPEKYLPFRDPSVPELFNNKADRLYRDRKESREALWRELKKVEQKDRGVSLPPAHKVRPSFFSISSLHRGCCAPQ